MNQFARIQLMLGEEGLQRLQAATVTVVGLGAVGSYATEALARSGVGRLRLFDFDTVQASNLNRQLYALHSTIGQPKSELAWARVLDINPECNVTAETLFVHADTVGHVLDPLPDVLVDAIDSLRPKAALLQAAVDAGVPHIVSSMGAARRCDPTQLRIDDISESRQCPLAKQVRKLLRQRGIQRGIRCVYSLEPVPPLAEFQEPDQPDRDSGQPKIPLPSLPTLTGIFGLCIANEVILHLAGGKG